MAGSPAAWWRPEVYRGRRANLVRRAQVVATIRAFFAGEGFVEVETPALQVSPGIEPYLNAFATRIDGARGGAGTLHLHTSPEYAMKKLLVAGEPRIFQLARCYRNAERGPTHHPEFTMLEWYRAGATYRAIMADCESILRAAAGPDGTYRWGGRTADPHRPWQYLTVAEAFLAHAGIDLLATAPDPSRPDAAALGREARRIGVRVDDGDGWDDVFFRVFLERIEPRLGHPVPTILYDYPVGMAALSRVKPDDPRLAERFELYVCGLELANAFGELTDAAEQRRRFLSDQQARRARVGHAYPIDEDFLAALEHGMPEASGIALGVDRLVMLATGAKDIADVLWAPVADAAGDGA
ncbi:MAG: EF-P lysine aminoacylase GenX [Alphaproteobacteria bacterium]|nr:EF-P lysine aminoacylase GenX [Alphaproteobacteria bacterium]